MWDKQIVGARCGVEIMMRLNHFSPALLQLHDCSTYHLNIYRVTMSSESFDQDSELSFIELGPVEPLLAATLGFLSCATDNGIRSRSRPSSKVLLARPTFERFRLWVLSFDTDECHLDKLLDDTPQLKEAVVQLLSSFVMIVVEEFGYRLAPTKILSA